MDVVPEMVEPKHSPVRGRSVAFLTASTSRGRVWNEWLRDEGASVMVMDHQDALQMLRDDMSADFDLCIADYLPHHLESLQLAEQFKQLTADRAIPVVALVPADDTASALQAIFPVTMVKPVIPADFVRVVEKARQPDQAWRSTSTAAPAESHRSLKIMLADDSPVNQEVAKGLLEMRSHHVSCVCNGHEAVAAAAAEHFDLILMDVEMPEMDGLEAARRVRRLQQYANHPLRIIAMTARSESELQGDEPPLFDGYLPKPIDPQRLFDLVESGT
jgi:CheY-like chemotaxis protein